MTTWMVDCRDRVAQRVVADYDPPPSIRFVKVEANTVREAIDKASPSSGDNAAEPQKGG